MTMRDAGNNGKFCKGLQGDNDRRWYSRLCCVAYVMCKYRMPFNEETRQPRYRLIDHRRNRT